MYFTASQQTSLAFQKCFLKEKLGARVQLTLFLLLVQFIFSNIVSAQVCWYYTPVTVNNPGGVLNNYPLLVTLNTQVLINDGKLRADGGDLRFEVSLNSGIYYTHWIESGLNSSETRIWVKIAPNLPTGSTTIYVRHGNPLLTYANDPRSVFPNFSGPINTPPNYTDAAIPLDNVYIQFSFYEDGFTGTSTNLWGGIIGTQSLLVGVREGSGSYADKYWYVNSIGTRYQVRWYLNGNLGNPLNIDRSPLSIGWHKVRMALSGGNAKLYFDDYESDVFAYSAASYNATNFTFYSSGHSARFDSLFYFNYPSVQPTVMVGAISPSQPASQPTSLTLSASSSSITGSYTPPVIAPSGYLVVRKSGSAPSFVPQDGNNYSGLVTGNEVVVYAGPLTSFTDNFLSPCTDYYYRIFAYNESASCIDYLVDLPLAGNRQTSSQQPVSQPSMMTFAQGSDFSIVTVSYNATSASTTTGYLVVRNIGSQSTFVPVDGTDYAFGSTTSSGIVVYNGSDVSFQESSLLPCTSYYYSVFAYSRNGSCIDYLTTSPLSRNWQTASREPTTQPYSIRFSPSSTSMQVQYTAPSTIPSGYLVVRKMGSPPSSVPDDGIRYGIGATMNPTDPTEIVAYVGAGTSFYDFSLTSCMNYFYNVYSYYEDGSCINYLTTSPLSGNQQTLLDEPTAQATSLTFTSVGISSMNVQYTMSSGTTGYLVVRGVGSSPSFSPTDNTLYSTGQQITGNDVVIAYVGSSNSFTDMMLTSCTNYFYRVYAYNQSGSCINYLVQSPLSGFQQTSSQSPATQPTSLRFSILSSSQMRIEYSPATGVVTGYLVLRNINSDPAFVPADGEAYTMGTTVGNDMIVYKGSDLSFIESILPCTDYHYSIFAYTENGACVDYFNTSPLIGSRLTPSREPLLQPLSLILSPIGISSMEVRYSAPATEPTGYIVVRKIGSRPLSPPQDGINYSKGDMVGTDGVVAYTGALSTFIDDGLQSCTNYYYAVYAYYQDGICIDYLISSPLLGNQQTLPDKPLYQPTGMQFSNVTTAEMDVSFSTSFDLATGYLVIRGEGSPPTSVPVDGITYVAGAPLGDGIIVYTGPQRMFHESSLESCTNYFYKIYAYKRSGACVGYLTTAPLTGNQQTQAQAQGPISQPTSLVFSPGSSSSSVIVSYRAASELPSGYIVIRKDGSAPTSVPADGVFYTTGSILSDGTVAYVGPNLSFTETIIGPCIDYYYAIYSFNGGGLCIQYLSSAPLTGHYTNKLTPVITSISPNEGQVDDIVIIQGSNFSEVPEDNFVTFNGVSAVVLSSSTSQIECKVPEGSTTGNINVQICGVSSLSTRKFTVYDDEMIISNLITPYDVDGINDNFYIKNIQFTNKNKVILIDRYGVIVKQWTNFKNFDDPDGGEHIIDFNQLVPGNYICLLEYQLFNETVTKRKKQMISILKSK